MVRERCFLLAVLLLFCFGQSYSITPEVQVNGGRIRGSIMMTERNRTILAFRGIPFAEPPKRFQPPEPKKPWGEDVVIDASKDGPQCYQMNVVTREITGQEDCLYLNVYTLNVPKDPSNADLNPVMFYIFGGGFLFGTGASDFYGPGKLMDTGIVLVTTNYRLGALGFLSTGDSSSPGNYGLLDQLEALKWVNANIDRFGGDPKRITIFGNSAGSASVTYQMLSPLSKGLFHAAIAMSGSALCSWTFEKHHEYWNKKIGERLGCSTENSSSFVACLKEKSAEDITRNIEFYDPSVLPLSFLPAIDNYFLLDTPANLLSSGKVHRVPFVTGITADEGALFLAIMAGRYPSKTTFNKTDVLEVLTSLVSPNKNQEKAAKFLHEMYFKNVDYTSDFQVRTAIVKAFSEYAFKTSHYQIVQLMAKIGIPTYVYSYEYVTNYSFVEFFKYKGYLGVGHMDDLYTLFDGPTIFGKHKLNEQDERIGRLMRTLLTNFAKVKSPTPDKNVVLEWPPIMVNKTTVYHIKDPVTVDEFQANDHEWYKWWAQNVPEILGGNL